jgi:hypothetical protein
LIDEIFTAIFYPFTYSATLELSDNAHDLYGKPAMGTACDVLKIKLDNQDFKNYIITSLARMYENEDLEELINKFRVLFDESK